MKATRPSSVTLTAASKRSDRYSGFRVGIFAFGIVIGAYSAWLLGAELCRANIAYWPSERSKSREPRADRDQAKLAARIGALRGELWTDYALVLSDFGFLADSAKSLPPDWAEAACGAARRAGRLAPYDSRNWLIVASFCPGKKTELLKMAYYTGPTKLELAPVRLLLATGAAVLPDRELSDLIAHDLEMIISLRPDLKPEIVVAFQSASVEGKLLIDQTVVKLDPELSAAIRKASAQ